jgi:anaerobic magnesium-protoporphyrin IX monomethyl ester cyclase
MKIGLIDTGIQINSNGLRTISSVLKKNGHKTKLIFLTPGELFKEFRYDSIGGISYSHKQLEDLSNIIKKCDLVGISVMTNYFEKSAQVTHNIKCLDIPVAWGGIHPMIKPEESLKYADMVCLGEGEEAILELVNKMEDNKNYFNIKNFWFKNNNKIIKNSIRPLIDDINTLPFPDYDLKNSYVIRRNRIIKMNKKILEIFLRSHFDMPGGTYLLHSSRGCPHSCSYCCNNALKKFYDGQRYLRFRSIDKIMEEIEIIKNNFRFINSIWFTDDSFFARSLDEIKEFNKKYKEKFDMPFTCYTSILTLTEEKLALLIDAGLSVVEMGIQTGSNRTNREVYNRAYITKENILAASKILNKFSSKKFGFNYHFIIDNPYERNEDFMETVEVLKKLKVPFTGVVFSLVLYPGTQMYEMAKKDGIIKDDVIDIYRKNYHNNYGGENFNQHTYLEYIIMLKALAPKFFSNSILNILTKKQVVKIADSFPKPLLNKILGQYTIPLFKRFLRRKVDG